MIGLLARAVEEVLGAVLIASSPNTFQVARVPVPTALSETDAIPYTVSVSAPATLVGPSSGVVSGVVRGASGGGRRYVLLTLRFSANAAAGPSIVARVTFGTGEDRRIVPIIANVAPSRRVVLTPDADMRAARHGELVTLHYVVENDGNAVDTVGLRVTPPPGWTVNLERSPLVLMPGASGVRSVSLRVPRGGASGDFIVGASALARDGERAQSTSTVSVLDASAADIREGPTLTTALSSVTGGGTATKPVVSIAAAGEIGDGVRLDAQFAPSNVNDPAAARSLLRVGTYQTPFFATLAAPGWRVGLGTTGQALSDLTGVSASGQGVSLQGTRGANTLALLATSTALGASPLSGTSTGTSTGARYQIQSEDATTSITAVHINNGTGDLARELNAFGVGVSNGDPAGGTLTSELALRQFQGGGGLGWNLRARREGDTLSYDFQVIHAPGGSAAFAAATDGLNGTVARRLTDRVRIFANAWEAADDNPAFGALASHGWTVSPQTRIAGTTYLDLDLHANSFETIQTLQPVRSAGLAPAPGVADTIVASATSLNSTGFGTRETGGGATLRTEYGAVYSSAQVALASVEETTEILGRRFDEYSPRATFQATIGMARGNGVIEANLNNDITGGSASNASSLMGVRADHITLPDTPAWLLFDGESQRIKSSARAPALTSYRLGFQMLLGEAYALHVEAERNPYYATAQGHPAVMFSVKVERSIRLPMLRRGGVTGHVFQDLNGNGVRDAGEPGMANVVVYSGGERGVTDENGSYRLFSRTTERPVVDIRSLPFGWTLETDAVNAGHDGDIPIVAHTSAQVALVPVADALGHVSNVDWSKVDVFVRDARGREWLARSSGAGTYTFDALPPGEYAVRVDAMDLDEPLALQGEPKLTLSARGTVGRLTLPLYPRAVRMWRANPPTGIAPDSLKPLQTTTPDR